MDYIVVMAVTEPVGRELAVAKTGYAPDTLGRVVLVVDKADNSRQRAFVFETTHDVTGHPLYTDGRLSDAFQLSRDAIDDGPMLQFGPEVTVGG